MKNFAKLHVDRKGCESYLPNEGVVNARIVTPLFYLLGNYDSRTKKFRGWIMNEKHPVIIEGIKYEISDTIIENLIKAGKI